MEEASQSTPHGIIAEIVAETGGRSAEEVRAISQQKKNVERAERRARRERQRLAALEPAGIPLITPEEEGIAPELVELRRKDREEKIAEVEVEVRAAEYVVRCELEALQKLHGRAFSPAEMGIVVAPQRFPR